MSKNDKQLPIFLPTFIFNFVCDYSLIAVDELLNWSLQPDMTSQ